MIPPACTTNSVYYCNYSVQNINLYHKHRPQLPTFSILSSHSLRRLLLAAAHLRVVDRVSVALQVHRRYGSSNAVLFYALLLRIIIVFSKYMLQTTASCVFFFFLSLGYCKTASNCSSVVTVFHLLSLLLLLLHYYHFFFLRCYIYLLTSSGGNWCTEINCSKRLNKVPGHREPYVDQLIKFLSYAIYMPTISTWVRLLKINKRGETT